LKIPAATSRLEKHPCGLFNRGGVKTGPLAPRSAGVNPGKAGG
jgi:hypothetical protein